MRCSDALPVHPSPPLFEETLSSEKYVSFYRGAQKEQQQKSAETDVPVVTIESSLI